MANPISQKTYKIELELTLTMDEFGGGPPRGDGPSQTDLWLRCLQRALVDHEPVLFRQMLSAIAGKLQEYADYLARQDDLTSLRELAEHVDTGPEGCLPEGDLAGLTRPIRVSNTAVQIDSSTIQEKVAGEDGEAAWQPVWTDLRPRTDLGKWWGQMGIPIAPVPFTSQVDSGHYLLVRYITRQRDGVHVEGRCSCQKPVSGVGADEVLAFDNLWRGYQEHLKVRNLAKRIGSGLIEVFRKSKP